MRKVSRRKTIMGIVFAILILTICLFYSRPMSVTQLYPMLTLDKCTGIRGYYEVGMQEEQTAFTVERDSEEFQKLCGLFFEKKYRRSFKDILPRGTRIHRTEPDDFQWDVYFCFENIVFPDGNIGSGSMLHFQSWYGEMDIYFDGERYSCNTSEQEIWEKEILDIIQSADTEGGSSA